MKIIKRILEGLFIFNIMMYVLEFIFSNENLLIDMCNIIFTRLRFSTSLVNIITTIIDLNIYITIVGGLLFLYDMFLNQKNVN